MNTSWILLLALVAVVGVNGCTQYGSPAAPPPTGEVTQEISVSGTEFSFSPSTITVNQGEVIKITFTNTGSIGHNFGISQLGVRTATIPAGGTDSVIFTASQSGTFAFDCSVPGHAVNGMTGELTVG